MRLWIGGGHIVRQPAHVGFPTYRVYDGSGADESNLNRLVIAAEADAAAGALRSRAGPASHPGRPRSRRTGSRLQPPSASPA